MNAIETNTQIKNDVLALVRKAAETERSDDAMRFSQAALNAANVALSLHNIENPR